MSDDRTDGDLVELAKARSADAYLLLVSRYKGIVAAAVYTLIPDPREVEEVCEDAFAEAWRKLADLRAAWAFGAWVRKIARRPMMVKLSPNVARIEPLARSAEDAGADAVSLVNTFVALAVDPRTRKPRLGAGFGGLSGPAIKPIALRMVYEAARSVKIPVVGLGGIASGLDAAEFLIAGASAVQVGTANFWDPAAPVRVARELDQFLHQEGIEHANNLIGTLKL